MAVGTAALVIALALNAGFVRDIEERIYSGAAHLTILQPDSAPFEGVPGLLQTIEGVNGVEAAGPVVYAPAMLVVPGEGEPQFAEVIGIDAERHQQVVREIGWEESPFASVEAPTTTGRSAILVGRGLARKLRAYETKPIQVIVAETTLTPWGPTPRQKVFELNAVYDSDQFEQDTRRAYVRIEELQPLLRAG